MPSALTREPLKSSAKVRHKEREEESGREGKGDRKFTFVSHEWVSFQNDCKTCE